jgi:hypothetical protein
MLIYCTILNGFMWGYPAPIPIITFIIFVPSKRLITFGDTINYIYNY